MHRLAAFLTILPYLTRPKSAAMQLTWIARRKHYRRIATLIREHFDEAFYRSAYPEVSRLKVAPMRHFVLRGWKEGKDPSELFSTMAYLQTYHDVRDAKVNPLVHYLRDGRHEGRVATLSRATMRSHDQPTVSLVVPTPPSDAQWQAMPQRVVDPPNRRAVNVIVPVYKGLPHVAATLSSLLRAPNDTPFEALVVDDASPEPEVSALLARLAASGHIRLLINRANLGFVASVNRAMAANEARDVVLLNSDTFVHAGWLDRLMRPLADDPSIATVTPLSNNATIASYPLTATDNNFELEVDSDAIDRMAGVVNEGTLIDLPTGIGFCMAIRRAALTGLGPFDAKTFGIGYGEECDFCMRALKQGWRNVLAANVYVRHYGGTAFGPGASERSRKAQARLVGKHPDYPGRVDRYLKADPVLPARILLDVARLHEAIGPISLLFFTHTRGGGVETYLDHTRRKLVEDGLEDVANRALVLQSVSQGVIRVAPFGDAKLPFLPNLEQLNVERHRDLFGRIIAELAPELMVVNSFAGLTIPSIERLTEAIKASGRPYWHVWHDHQPLCPRLTFLDSQEHYCGEQDASRCVPCLGASPSAAEWVRIDEWRERFRRYLAGAEVISAPSEAAAVRARRLADVAKVKVHPHPEPTLAELEPLARPARREGPRRILVLGAIGPHKGAYLIEAMIADMRRRSLPLHVEIVGYTSLRSIATGPNVTLHGRYPDDRTAVEIIRRVEPDLCLAASVWPETYLYTLSVAIALGLPTVAFDFGAQGERVGHYGRGVVLDAKLREDPLAINNALMELDVEALWRRPANHAFANRLALSERLRPTPRDPTAAAPASAQVETAGLVGAGSGARSERQIAAPR